MNTADIAEKVETNKQLFEDQATESERQDDEEEVKQSYVGEQLDDGNKNAPGYKPNQKTGRRSEAFDFLLSQENKMPQSKYSSKRDTYEQYVNDLCEGEIEKENERLIHEQKKKAEKMVVKAAEKQAKKNISKDNSQVDRETGTTSQVNEGHDQYGQVLANYQKALSNVSVTAIQNLRSLNNPTSSVLELFQILALFFDMQNATWSLIKKSLMNKNLLTNLKNFDIENSFKPATHKAVLASGFFQNNTYDSIKSKSKDLAEVFMWVQAVHDFHCFMKAN